MNRVNRRIPRYSLAIAAILATGVAHAASNVATPGAESALTPAASAPLAVVWDELSVGGDKRFNTFIQGNSAVVTESANGVAAHQARPAPSLLWVLGAGIIGLATVARRRSQ
ncbi:MAG: hypothetical protein J5I92_00165 [Thiogranum sp.]|nr:hypothetical protein [Thiogranum sp.]